MGENIELDPCGECPKGECDMCEGCRWILDLHELLKAEGDNGTN